MAEASEHSQNTGKRNTKKTAPLTQEEALQILQESFRICEQAGVTMEVETDGTSTRVMLFNVAYFEGNLVRTNIGTD